MANHRLSMWRGSSTGSTDAKNTAPPDEGIQVFEDDALHATLVNRTSVVVTYLVVAHERLMVLKTLE